MIHWLHHLLNPHCTICEKIQKEEFEWERERFRLSLHCRSCDNLKIELAQTHKLNHELIEKLTEKPVVNERPVELGDEVLRTIKTPWKLKRQLLEEADRKESMIRAGLKESMSPVKVVTEDDLEKELKELDATSKSVS